MQLQVYHLQFWLSKFSRESCQPERWIVLGKEVLSPLPPKCSSPVFLIFSDSFSPLCSILETIFQTY